MQNLPATIYIFKVSPYNVLSFAPAVRKYKCETGESYKYMCCPLYQKGSALIPMV